MPVYIYGLVDPRDGLIRYVGQTVSLIERRLYAHVSDAKRASRQPPYIRSRKEQWLVELLAEGMTPEVVILAETSADRADADELAWIRQIAEDVGSILNTNGAPDVKECLRLHYEAKPSHVIRQPDLPIPPPPTMSPTEIRERRQQLGLSQGMLARVLGYHYSAVSLWESGKRTPPPGLGVLFDRLEQLMKPSE